VAASRKVLVTRKSLVNKRWVLRLRFACPLLPVRVALLHVLHPASPIPATSQGRLGAQEPPSCAVPAAGWVVQCQERWGRSSPDKHPPSLPTTLPACPWHGRERRQEGRERCLGRGRRCRPHALLPALGLGAIPKSRGAGGSAC